MINPLYVVFGAVFISLYVGWVFAFGTESALILCLFLLPFRIVLPPNVGSLVGFESLFLVPDVLIPLTFGVWVLKRFAARERNQRVTYRAMLPRVMVVLFVALAVSYNPAVDLRSFLSDLQKWFVYGLTFVLVAEHCSDAHDLNRVVNALLIGGVVVTLRDVIAYSSLFNLPAPFGYSPNRDAFLFSAFDLQRYQGTGWPFFINTLLLFVFSKLAIRTDLARTQRVVLLVYGAVLLSLLALSFYRGDWVALGCAIGASLWLPRVASPRLLRAVVPLSALAVLLMALATSGIVTSGLRERFQTLLSPGSEEHVLVRLDAMAEGWRMFRDHPLTGIGLGQFGQNFEQYTGAQIFGLAIDPSFYQQANNDYVQYLATTGLIGFVALATFFSSMLLRNYRLIICAKEAQTRAVLVGCFLSVIAFLVTALSQDPTWDKTYGALLFTVFGLVWSVQRQVA